MKGSLEHTDQLNGYQEFETPDNRLLNQLFKLMDGHLTEHRPVPYYAKALHTTPACLNKLTRAYLNKSVHDLLQDKLVNAARYYLARSMMSVKDITYTLGFEDTAYFCRWFKRITRQTPMQYRRDNVMLKVWVREG
ncbi:AraC-like DNA-binding protein [Pedobacter sp. AK017]|uniref:helix-turn-helix domain-containing protein n=1 Tax=Pedobacter sp. AK017 TaxID=2723073 RepID=UPI00161A7170|nr:helix-turn-helix transcriptional regulator [Pedobacter sp. AK017]MBB5438004.1 AraC-like DNA-binding protein [Pedobacter sp. AK017]